MNFATSNEFIFSNEQLLQRVTSEFLQRATSATSNEQILHRVTRNLLQRATSATSNKRILQRVTSVLQPAVSDFTTSNEQQVNFKERQVKSYASTLL